MRITTPNTDLPYQQNNPEALILLKMVASGLVDLESHLYQLEASPKAFEQSLPLPKTSKQRRAQKSGVMTSQQVATPRNKSVVERSSPTPTRNIRFAAAR